MSRVIKFRAWDNGEMFYQQDKDGFTIYNIEKLFSKISGVAILMQFTGLIGRNGVEIYEGDIIDVHNDEEPMIVEYNPTDACFELGTCGFFDYNREYFEVIGNIYENPTLS